MVIPLYNVKVSLALDDKDIQTITVKVNRK